MRGTIREIGENVKDREPGQRVVAVAPFGSHAAMTSVPAASTWPIPDGLELREAAAVPIAAGTAHVCLFEFGRLEAGETVLVQGGSGGVGTFAIQLAKKAGATVLATASTPSKLERMSSELGLDHGIDYTKLEIVEEVRRLTGGRGVDLAVDSVGSTLLASIESLAYRGRAVTVGDMGRGRKPLDPGVLMERNLTLVGVFLGAELFAGTRARDMIGRHIADVATGDLQVVVDREFPLSEAAAAHAYIESRQAFGRVLLIP